MRLAVVSRHLPELEGSAAGRVLRATAEGLTAEGHEVRVWSWRPEPPREELPGWCSWRPLSAEGALRRRGHALLWPRGDVARAVGRELPAVVDADVVVADDPVSFPAVAVWARGDGGRGGPGKGGYGGWAGGGRAPSVLTAHYLTRLDAGFRGRQMRDLQDLRAEGRAIRSATLVLAYSERVATAAARSAGRLGARRSVPAVVPVAFPVPAAALAPVERPVAGLLADWRWPPNQVAGRRLLEAWPAVRARVPGARLLLAGPGAAPLEGLAGADLGGLGVEVHGPVAHSAEVLGACAVLAFPCPPTSGPKVKVLEALAHGVPVVTTAAGVEGLVLGPEEGAVVVTPERFGAALAELLLAPERRAALGASGRRAVLSSHAPGPAARARLAALAPLVG